MRPVKVSAVGPSGASEPITVDWNLNPFQVGFGCVVSGTIGFSVQHTFDDVQDPTTSTLWTWFNHPAVSVTAASVDGNYAFPVRAIRVKANSGTGSVDVTLIQAGNSY